MDVLHAIILILHFAGVAAILGGAAEQWRRKDATPGPIVVWGARAQLITGLILVALAEMGDGDVNHAKVGVKLVIALAVAALAEMNAKKQRVPNALVWIVALAAVNVAVAVAWH